MKILSVRVGRLKSLPGYNNVQVAADAVVATGEDPAKVREDLSLWCEAELSKKSVEELRSEVCQLDWQVEQLIKRKAALENEVEQLRVELSRPSAAKREPLHLGSGEATS